MARNCKWTQEETDLLLEQYGLISDKLLAEKLGRSVTAMLGRANKLHLIKDSGFITARVLPIFSVLIRIL